MLEDSGGVKSAGNVAIVIGASSQIAMALISRLQNDESLIEIIAISRQHYDEPFANDVSRFQSDYSEESIREICEQIKPRKGQVSRVFICNGVLHDTQIRPEKRLEDIKPENLHTIFAANAVVPMLWIKYLKPILMGKQSCVVTTFSARIGSIEDNRLGGWYSYRASKAALNMLLKTAAIEYQRVAKGVRFLVFHPGTTDTPLSKPFQKFVSKDKLFTPEFVADQLLTIVEQQASESNIQFLDWDGKAIPW